MTADDEFSAVAARFFPGDTLRAVRRLTGGVSADVVALDLEAADGGRRTVVMRCLRAGAAKPAQGQSAATEHALLEALHRAGLPVAKPLLVDTSGELLSRPYLVTTFVEGSTEIPGESLDAALETMADMLAHVHAVPTENVPELPLRTDPLPEVYDYLPDGDAWPALREHLAGRNDTAYAGPLVLLHGDFWPGNLLWQDGRLAAILDWEDAALGDPHADVAGCRLELLWRYGSEAMEQFTAAYARERTLDGRRLALWEVFVSLAAARFMGGWGLEREREREMRTKAHWFAQEAAHALVERSDRC